MRPVVQLITIFLLSSFRATDARLRNKDETTSCENEADFECEPGVCIDQSLKCNWAYDCASMADETVQLCGCLPDEFQCQNSCIPLEKRCDRSCDCEDNCADEEHCDSFPCLRTFNKCDNHFCVSHFDWCNFNDDCGDMSDEMNCTRGECWTTQFRCENQQCINYFFICDGILDCADGSDEDSTLCSEDNFVDCGDGTRVHRHNFCDGHAHCPVTEADESNCTCNFVHQFQCANSKCIPLAKVCDRRCDCLDCDDEVDCYNKDDCNTDEHIFCPSFTIHNKPPICLRKEYICDGKKDCEDNNVDEACPVGDCNMFDCGGEDKRCMPEEHTLCNNAINCLAGTDENQNCSNVSECKQDEFQCEKGGKCIPSVFRCDAVVDCFDGSDEENCELFECPDGKLKCAGGQCIYEHYFCDYYLDCFYHNGKRDTSDEADCMEKYKKTCGEDEFRCRSGQCIPAWRRCFADRKDNYFGCADKSHLRNCSDFVCPDGAFKCSRSHCINESMVCDRNVDCIESWDDEALPDESCSQDCSTLGCNCTGHIQNCTDVGLQWISLDLKAKDIQLIRDFYLRGNNLSRLLESESALKGMKRMELLDLSDNGITRINNQALRNVPNLHSLILEDNMITVLESNTFLGMSQIKTLTLNGNKISIIEEKAFFGLKELTTLDLSGQNLRVIQKGAFEGLNKLSFLDLSNNILTGIPHGAFFGLKELTNLDISDNKLQHIEVQAFYGLPKLRKLNTDEYRFCCVLRDMESLEECTPSADAFSSCEDLMANVFLRGSIWVVGIIASVGNLVVIMMRMNNKRDHRFIVRQAPLGAQFPELVGPTWVHSFLITNLAIGDFCMGVYLLIIASVDAYYRGFYILYDAEWRKSHLCHFAGFLSTFSSELSVFSLTIITLHRLFSILFPFRIKDMEIGGAVLVMLIAWLMVTFLAAFPLVGLPYFRQFYGRSGVCLALHITGDVPAGWEYSVFIFLVLNFLSFAVIAMSYTIMFVVARRTQKAVKRSRDANTGDAMARRMTLIVATDFVCWIPIILLGVASLCGANIPPQVFAWVAVFVLPVNSAINPMLYTLLTAPYVRRVMSRARTSLNMPLTTMSTDMKQVNYTGDRQSRKCNGRQGWQKGIRLPKADDNRNSIKLNTMISQSDTEPDETTKAEEFTLLRGAADTTDIEEEPRADGFCRARDETEAEDSMYLNV